MLRILAVFLALFLCAGRAEAEPALWSVRDADSVLYLFGTFHALPKDLDWQSEKIRAAFAASEALWVEVANEDDAGLRQLVAQHGLGREPLSRKLSLTERRQLIGAAKAVGIHPDHIMAYRPWFAALSLTFATAQQAGFAPEAGADQRLQEQAKATGKEIRSFETMEQQVRFFADLPPELELDMLRQTLAEFSKGAVYLQKIMKAWAESDLDLLERDVNGSMRADLAALYDILIVQRNAAWTAEIEKLMKGSGTAFIAVGAGHLVGPDSVIADLKKRGFAVILE